MRRLLHFLVLFWAIPGADAIFDFLKGFLCLIPILQLFFDCGPAITPEQAVRNYFADRRSNLNIVATTTTASGQVIDWINPQDQVPAGTMLAEPPSDSEPPSESPVGPPIIDQPGNSSDGKFELEDQPNNQGPEGSVPILRRDSVDVGDEFDGSIADFLNKYGRDGKGIGLRRRLAFNEYAHSGEYRDNFGESGVINVWNPYVWKSSEFLSRSVCRGEWFTFANNRSRSSEV